MVIDRNCALVNGDPKKSQVRRSKRQRLYWPGGSRCERGAYQGRDCSIIEALDNRLGAAKILGVDQPKLSALKRNRLEGFSTDRLFKFLNALHIEVVIKKIDG